MIEPAVAVNDPHFISVRGLCKSFGRQVLYDRFDLDLPQGRLISVFGPNGCGKSTLINMLSGLTPYDAGQVRIGGHDLRSAKIGYVFQNYRDSLFPWLRALDNIEYPLRVRGVPRAQRKARVERLLAAFEITLDLQRHTYELSGGQQQLVAILRALIAEPEVLFLDEPFSALDYEMTLYMRDRLQAVFVQSGLTLVVVSHDLEEAVYLADLVLLLSKRPTRIVELVEYDTARPRTADIMADPRFVAVKAHCLDVFRREMRK